MVKPPTVQAELIESAPLYRAWSVRGAWEATIEWNLDHAGWSRYFGHEQISVNGRGAWRDLALTQSLVYEIPFELPSPEGLLVATIERIVMDSEVAALRLCIDGIPVYEEGDVQGWLPSLAGRRPELAGLPLPGRPPGLDASDLPIPGPDREPDEPVSAGRLPDARDPLPGEERRLMPIWLKSGAISGGVFGLLWGLVMLAWTFDLRLLLIFSFGGGLLGLAGGALMGLVSPRLPTADRRIRAATRIGAVIGLLFASWPVGGLYLLPLLTGALAGLCAALLVRHVLEES